MVSKYLSELAIIDFNVIIIYYYEKLLNMANSTYFLKITGSISWGKHREFQQTVLFVFNHLPAGCLVHDLAQDVFNINVFHLFTVWNSKEALATFKNSHEYQLLKGSFQTLGSHDNTVTGKLADVQLFESIESNK